MLLVDGHVLGRAVYLRGGGVDELGAAVFLGRLADVEGALDIGVHIAVRSHVGVWDGDEGGQVENDIHFPGDMFAVMRVADVAGEYFYLG